MNIVFDLGGVVFNWRPQALIDRIFADTATRSMIMSQIVQHPDWLALDRGTLPLDDAIVRGAARTGLSREDIRRFFDEVPHSLTPIEASFDLIRSLAETEHRLFVLSNMHFASIAVLEREYDIWDKFEGVVVSCRIEMIKPETGIYEHLLATHGLIAADTVFIDDLQENLDAAATRGIETIRFQHSSQCRQDLERLINSRRSDTT